MQYKLVIEGRLEGLNTLILENRKSKYKGAALKKQEQKTVYWYMQQQLKGIQLKDTDVVDIDIDWYEANLKRDKDNISSAKKYIFDTFQEANFLVNDNWKHIRNLSDKFYLDRKNPRIEVFITVLTDEEKKEYFDSLK